MDIDALDASAIIKAQLEDGEILVSNARDSDFRFALQMHMNDLSILDAGINDTTMAQSFANFVLQDGESAQEAHRPEQRPPRDHQLAQDITDSSNMVEAAKQRTNDEPNPRDNQERLNRTAAHKLSSSQYDPGMGIGNHEQAESSARIAPGKENAQSARRNCIACEDEKNSFEVVRLPCDHEYCQLCLKNLFSLSMEDETLFPPRCDGEEIALKMVRSFLPAKLVADFEAKYEELSTKNRTYCHDARCLTFIPTSPEDEYGTCPSCSKTTCTSCKQPSHTGDCPEDTALDMLKETANAAQWQRCYLCNRFVELRTGCNHIRCPCGAQFCYVCGREWRSCECPQVNEHRLLEPTTEIVGGDPTYRLFQPQRVAHTQSQKAPYARSSAVAADSPAALRDTTGRIL